MINQKYFSFSRNNYYDGKLLSANDFEAEQKYMNDKRRLVNRFVGGFGVVCGMEVVIAADDTISVEAGFAIDGFGRELVIEEPFAKKLSSISGFSPNEDNLEYYLFAEYHEKPTAPALSLEQENSNRRYNRISENCSLYVTERAPTGNLGTVAGYYKSKTVIFSNDEATVVMTTPRFLKAADRFILTVEVIPENIQKQISLETSVQLTCMKYKSLDHIPINFNSRDEKLKNGRYVLEYICSSMNITEDLAVFEVHGENFRISCGGTVYSAKASARAEAIISHSEPEASVIESYSSEIANYAMHTPFRDVCLAKINLLQASPCIIENVERVPFGQRILTNAQLALENEILRDRITVLSETIGGEKKKSYTDEHSNIEISTGETVINIGIGGRAGKRFFSDEISHGLGMGNVTVIVGKAEDAENSSVVYGSGEIFNEDKRLVQAETAVKVNPQSGTFVIGIRLLAATSAYEVPIRWTALRRRDNYSKSGDRRIVIHNGARSIRVMESVYFSVEFINMNQTDIRWFVEGENSGTINESGCYTAPNHPGVFEVRAVCTYDSDISASAFIVVKP